jgi:hypothetical protein
VFVGPKGATPSRGSFASIWQATKCAAGVPAAVHFHDLRYTGNHLAASARASTKELTGWMDHASMRAALIYQHRTAARDRAIGDSLNRMLEASDEVRGTMGARIWVSPTFE